MAMVSDCFSVGSVVWCRTCLRQDIEGEVLAFDPDSRMLILKTHSSSGNMRLHDVHFINLSLVSDVHIKKEVSGSSEPPQTINLEQIKRRVSKKIEERKRLLSAMSAGVDADGQQLFMTIAKTIADVGWNGPNITVFNQLTITPPYKVENIIGDPESKDYIYIRKVVERHCNERQQNKQ